MKITTTQWKNLTPSNFEELCADLLRRLGFQNVRIVAGAGDKGRDLLCEREFNYGSGLSDRFSLIVQCKHYGSTLGKAVILEDLAAAKEHKCDIWWLMTSTKLSPALGDWLQSVGRRDFPFRVDFRDRPILEALVVQFPEIITKYFPEVASGNSTVIASVMRKMAEERFQEAVAILHSVDDGANPHVSYLLACSYARLAQEDVENKTPLIAKAFENLRAAADRHLLASWEALRSWPESKSLRRIHEDPDLEFLRQTAPGRFNEIFPKSEGGGCFPAETRVTLSDGAQVPIESIEPGNSVVALIAKHEVRSSTVVAIRKTRTPELLEINKNIQLSPRQRLHNGAGWVAADTLSLGDVLVTSTGPELVVSIERIVRDNLTVYELRLDGLPFFYAEGYLTHNMKE